MPIKGTGIFLMGTNIYSPIVDHAYVMGIPQWEITHFLRQLKALEAGEPYTPDMMKSIFHPYLKQKLLEAVCLRQTHHLT